MHFEEKDELVKKLTAIAQEKMVLVKASRGMKLEGSYLSKMMHKLPILKEYK